MSAELTAVVLAGLPGTGKSALAELLAGMTDAAGIGEGENR